MLYILLTIIAVGVLLASKEGKKLLKWFIILLIGLIILLCIGGFLLLCYWSVVTFIMPYFSSPHWKESHPILAVIGGIILGCWVLAGIRYILLLERFRPLRDRLKPLQDRLRLLWEKAQRPSKLEQSALFPVIVALGCIVIAGVIVFIIILFIK